MDQNRSKLVAGTGLMSNKANQTWPKNGKKIKKGGKYCIQRIMRLAKILFQPKNNWISEKISLRQIHTIMHGTVFARDKEKF